MGEKGKEEDISITKTRKGQSTKSQTVGDMDGCSSRCLRPPLASFAISLFRAFVISSPFRDATGPDFQLSLFPFPALFSLMLTSPRGSYLGRHSLLSSLSSSTGVGPSWTTSR